MKFSNFAQKFTQTTGISQLMDDIKIVMDRQAKEGIKVNMLGVGNPANIEAVNQAFFKHYQAISQQGIHSPAIQSLAQYAPPQGDMDFIKTLVAFFNRHYNWQLTTDNIALTNGSQNGFFYLFNLFAGKFGQNDEAEYKSILLPLVPDYVGYADVQVDGHFFIAVPPIIEKGMDKQIVNGDKNQGDFTEQFTGKGFFKYRVDFEALESLTELKEGKIGAICCSRPTNPSGNVLSDNEIARLDKLARQYQIPLIIDNAYGEPFPNIINTTTKLQWHDNIILCFSLSKMGLAGVRTGIIVACPEVIRAVGRLNAIINLAPTRFGATLAKPLFDNDEIVSLCQQDIRPFYQHKARFAIELLQEELGEYPLYIHEPQGAIFLWLWFENLPISSSELYQRLKEAGTLVIPSEHFFMGMNTTQYPHAYECIRISIATDDETLQKGIAVIGKVVRNLYNQSVTKGE